MGKGSGVYLNDIKIGSYISVLSICRDGYSFSSSPVPGFDIGEVLARVNQSQPLTSSDGSYQSEILKSVFNIGLKGTEIKPVWITPNSIRYRRHNPLVHGDKESVVVHIGSEEYILHRKFAGLVAKDEKAAIVFANKYGLLKSHDAYNLTFIAVDGGQQAQIGESWLWWREEISDLAACLKLWDMISREDKELKDIILWHRDGIDLKLDESYIQLVARRNMNLLSRWHQGDLKGPALYYISLELDRRLHNTLTPKIQATTNEICLFPDSLLSAIWFMFMLEINSVTRPLKCDICGEYFNSQDPRARFCSTRCRMRNYRSLQKSKVRRKIKAGRRT